MRRFLHGLSRLFREGETQVLEFVMGLMALLFGIQFFLGLLGVGNGAVLLRVFPFPLEFIVSLGLVVGAVVKIVGAALDHAVMRRWAALGTSTIWWTLIVVNFSVLPLVSLLFAIILALQSAWISIRLSLLRKQSRAS